MISSVCLMLPEEPLAYLISVVPSIFSTKADLVRISSNPLPLAGRVRVSSSGAERARPWLSLVEPGSGDASSGKTSEDSSPKASAAAEVYVDVDGAVVKPGVYRLKGGARVSQAIDAAGGFSEKANQTAWNLAEVLQDGMQVYIPSKDEAKEALNEEQSLGKDLSASQKEDTVNINTASKEELMTLPGIGESRADAVIACREEKGSFTSIEGIKDAAGIGDGIFNRIKDLITVN